MKAINLKTEYLKEPLGIDIRRPRLFWNCEGTGRQKAYRITAVTDGETVWDSGRVESSAMSHIAYEGKELHSGQRVEWSVTLWDEQDRSGGMSSSFFEMGLLHPADWNAEWIFGDYKVNRNRRYPVDCFRKVFCIGNTVKARLYAAACGVYEGRLNGRRIGDFVLAPGHTDYRRRIQYQTYDVLPLLKEGENTLTFELADGWYRGSCGAWGLRNQYGSRTKLLAQLELTDADGNVTVICSDGSWQWSNDGPIRFADNQDGEEVDARCAPSYTGKAKLTACTVVPTASNNVSVTEHERFVPEIIRTPSGKTVLDFGQNLTGYVEFCVQAKAGQRIFLRFGELMGKDEEFTQKNIQLSMGRKTTPLQQVQYLCRDGENHYKTKFGIFGFRYVLIETDVTFSPKDFCAIAVYSDLETTLRFESSNALLNRFVENTLWSAKNNSADVPTDCPTRERHGWTGDSQLFAVTAGYLMNYMPFARKHVRDLTDWQRKNGAFPQIAPAGGVDFYMETMNGSVGWADAGVLIPYRYWKLFGDMDFLRENYAAMARYARFMMRRCGKAGFMAKPLGLKGEARKYAVNAGQSYGEWAEPAEIHPNHWTDMVAPHPEVSTAYTAYVMGIMAEIAEALGEKQDVPLYKKYQKGCMTAYQALVETADYSLDTDRQAQLVRPLYFGLLNAQQTEYAKKRLLTAMEHYNWRVGTGFLSTPLILYVLAEIDIGAAYRLLENEEMPGWLFMPKTGATTIWESWEGTQAQGGIASLNHYSKGACCEWVFRVMCGIQVTGRNRFTIAPRPGGSFTRAKASYDSVYGTVECGWIRTTEGYRYKIVIPGNTTAEIRLPDGRMLEAAAGEYHL
ncbi:MAG: family 78 glycoside hydrolase catalytic domain [Oscillospiraceae bacterium]|nr:family 78 glycoside hydrolase catalytic domain [Oscillospiraceae bacterium]